jgi:nucleoside-diphosphate-sugar epimerase
MKALVTGGTGFVGSHVVGLLLENGHEVRIFSRRPEVPERWKAKSVSVFAGDLNVPESIVPAMEGMDLVFHIGEIANTSAAASEKNVRAVERIAGRFRGDSAQRLVFVSSISVAGIPESIPATEETRPVAVPKDHYTDYKRRAEEIIRQSPSVREFVIVRPGLIYGPGSRNLKRLAKKMARAAGAFGLPFPGPGKNLMPVVDVRDLARALLQAGLKPGAAGQTFNLTDGERHTWAEFFHAMAAALGTRVRIIAVPPLLLRGLAVFGNLAADLFGMRADLATYVSYFSKDLHFSAEKARTLLGWRPEHTDIEAGVREMLSQDS